MWGRPVILLCVVMAVQSGPNADFAPCPKDDKDCLVKIANTIFQAAVTGVPSMNIESLDPMYHEEIDGDLNTIKYKLTKATVKGYKACNVVDMVLSIEKHTLHLVLDCPRFDMNGIYEMDGTLVTLPIQGKGDFNMQCDNYHIEIDSDLKITEKDGKKYISLKNFSYNGQLQGGMIDLKNLFNGKKDLADNVLKFINKNFVAAAGELQVPVFKVNVKKLMKNFNKYMESTPVDSLIA